MHTPLCPCPVPSRGPIHCSHTKFAPKPPPPLPPCIRHGPYKRQAHSTAQQTSDKRTSLLSRSAKTASTAYPYLPVCRLSRVCILISDKVTPTSDPMRTPNPEPHRAKKTAKPPSHRRYTRGGNPCNQTLHRVWGFISFRGARIVGVCCAGCGDREERRREEGCSPSFAGWLAGWLLVFSAITHCMYIATSVLG